MYWLLEMILEKCQRVKIIEVEKEKEMNLENVIQFLTDLQKQKI